MARSIALLALVLVLVACGGGSAAAPGGVAAGGGGLRVVETRYADGQLAAQGTVLDENGTSPRQGHWRTWFASGQLRWEGDYRRDVVAADQPWREWNADGSVRDDSGDGAG